MDAGNPASACRYVKVEGKRKKARTRKTWSQLVSNDFKKMKLKPELAQNRVERSHYGTLSNPCLHGNGRKTMMMMCLIEINTKR